MEPPHSHPGAPPPRPEVPDRLPLAWSTPPPRAPHDDELPAWPPWAPLLAIGFTILVLVTVGTALFIAVELAGGDEDSAVVNIGATVVQDIALIASAIVAARLVAGAAAARDFGIRRVAFWPAVGWTAAALVTFYVFAIAYSAAVDPSPQEDITKELGADESTLALVASAVLLTVLAPIAEEFFFRGFFFTAMRRWIGMLPAATATGVVFGGIHAATTPIASLVVIAVLGFLLCLLYVKTRSLLPCIATHAVNNSIALGVVQGWGWEIPLVAGAAAGLAVGVTLPFARRFPRPASPALP